jgi:hypothetical protein
MLLPYMAGLRDFSVGWNVNHKIIVDTKTLKDMITVIKTERERRSALLQGEDPNFAYDQWLFTDEPFLNELCLMSLVALRHQIERELIRFAARWDEKQIEISGRQYQENIERLRRTNNKGQNIGWDWGEVDKRLNPKGIKNYEYIEALRLLSNLYKHEPSLKPDEGLLNLLQLKIGVNYAPLPESDALREGFANFLGLSSDSDYCDIAERFVDISNTFLTTVKSVSKLSKVKWGAISLNPDNSAR